MVLLRALRTCGLLQALQQHVCLARGRVGRDEVCDFVLLVYAVSQAPTLQQCYEALPRFGSLLAGLWERAGLPARATLSRFLAAMTQEAVAALRAVLLDDLVQRGLGIDDLGGLGDRQCQRHVVFDGDGTRQTMRQRALVASPDRPPARRRLVRLGAPGYSGRKHGDSVRTRAA